ncbi:uncharacterized protein LOC111266387 [Varroa jacobsoni]|uniref:uncharacterized protein LOC111266387 n=1 Tax=Varroa jacobsoni TaxID=62625 RepID=UPI000BF68B7F|nr:uncharacterized protein LOC111266387 [Varroa jacobsoni]
MWTLHVLLSLAFAVSLFALGQQSSGVLPESQDGHTLLNNTEPNTILSSPLHFSQRRIQAGRFPSTLSPGQVFYRVQVNPPDQSDVLFRVLAPKNFVSIDPNLGHLFLVRNLNESGHDFSNGLRVEVKASHDFLGSARTVVEFTGVIKKSEAKCYIPSRELCFAATSPEKVTIAVDDAKNTPLMYMLTPLQRFCNTTARYTFSESDLLYYDEATHTVRTTRPAVSSDFDPTHQSLTMSCRLNSLNGPVFNHTLMLVSAAFGIESSTPTETRPSEPFCDIISYKGRKFACQLQVLDVDPRGKFTVKVVNDSLNIFKAKAKLEFPNSDEFRRVIIDVNGRKGVSFYPNVYYNFGIILEERSTTDHTTYPKKWKFHGRATNHSLIEHRIDLSRAQSTSNLTAGLSSIYSRVIPALYLHGGERYKFIKDKSHWHQAFAVTLKEGIVYLLNPILLNKLVGKTVLLRVKIYRSRFHETYNDIINEPTHHDINVTVHQNQIPACNNTGFTNVQCSTYDSERECNSICGYGALGGHCNWGQGETTYYGIEKRHVNVSYLSCSPDLEHCPDQYCDELEEQVRYLCPQDCSDNVGLIARQASHPVRGIPADASEKCWCATTNQCTCDTFQSENKVETARSARRANEQSKLSVGSNARLCGPKGCANLLKVVGLGGMLLVFSVVAIFITLRRSSIGGPQKDPSLKHDTPATPDIPSVYDPESSAVFEGPDVKLLAMTGVDVRWEVCRDNLLFENLLGEGEFGKVVRAQAWSIAGRDGYSTVAVKMLKDNASTQDAQDLLQELQTLKEVDHVNVIKLLGACTSRDGPLYVIVEYCELGSLRSYLRRCRNISSIEDLRAVQNPTYLGEDPRTQLPATQQLISFMWQIARGMGYLSDMKVIHRDLATRNILVARDNVIKISDFGLSRDVYEGDTYLKRSRQKVPVKWMALESLEDQIYTTKSDVWSFGVVLWEIVTLGATPYPGINGELLCQLLKEGYRMFQPKHCSSQLYGLMRDCWKTDPNERPSFKVLAQKFDRLLQDTTVYLDVEDGVVTCSTYYNDESVTSEERDRGRSDDDESPGDNTAIDKQQHMLLQQQLHPLLSQQQELQLQLQQQRIDKDKEAERAVRVEAQLEGGVVRSHLLLKRPSTDGCSSSEYLNDDERSRLLHYAKMDFARSASESVGSDQEQTSSV